MTWKVGGVVGLGGLMVLNVLPVDQPCIWKVTYGSTYGLSPIVLRAQQLLLVEEEYRCKVVA